MSLYFEEDVEFLVKNDFESLLGNQRADRWVRKLLNARERSQDLKFVRLPPTTFDDRFHHLFFSEARVYDCYCETEHFPILNIKDNARICIVTQLPQNLLELEPEKFWEKWVFPLPYGLDSLTE